VLRQALFAWAFNPATRDTDPPPEIAAALDWAERASLPVADLEDLSKSSGHRRGRTARRGTPRRHRPRLRRCL